MKKNNGRLRRTGARLGSARVRALLSLGVVLGLTSVSTLAYWTDEATLTTGAIQSGKLDMTLESGQQNVASSTKLAITGMFPGESVAATIAVERTADSIPFTYTVTGKAHTTGDTSTANDLAKALRFQAFAGTASNSGGTVRAGSCSGAALTASAVSMEAVATLVTDRATLASGTGAASDNICIVASLPTATTNGQSSSASATLTFVATQVK